MSIITGFTGNFNNRKFCLQKQLRPSIFLSVFRVTSIGVISFISPQKRKNGKTKKETTLENWLGRQLIIEFNDCNRKTINDIEAVEKHLLEAVRLSGATVIEPFFHRFPQGGVSGIVVVAESHFSIHTWPEIGYAALDIFTCSETVDDEKALDYLKTQFEAKHCSTVLIKRGPLGPVVES